MSKRSLNLNLFFLFLLISILFCTSLYNSSFAQMPPQEQSQQALEPETPPQSQEPIQPEAPPEQSQEEASQPEAPPSQSQEQTTNQQAPSNSPQAPALPENASSVARQKLVTIFGSSCTNSDCGGCSTETITQRIGSPFENCCRSHPENKGCN